MQRALVHPKDKTKLEEVCGCVYRIPCKHCEAVYLGETGRKLGTRLSEHKKDSSKTPLVYTRSERKTLLTTEHSGYTTLNIHEIWLRLFRGEHFIYIRAKMWSFVNSHD